MFAAGYSSGPPRESGERVVLIVEDEPLLRTSMARGLSRLSSIEVVVAGNIADAKKLVAALAPRVLVLDLHLPDGSGLELLSELDRCKVNAAVIFVTAFPQKLAGRLPKRGIIVVLEKPVPMAELREKVIAGLDELGLRPQASAPFCLADYMQLAAFSRRTVRIDVYRRGERLGSVWVQNGDGYHAQDRRGTGVESLRRLLRASDATPECVAQHDEPTMPRTLSGSCEELLLDSTRFFDESRASGDPFEDGLDEAPPRSSAVDLRTGEPLEPRPADVIEIRQPHAVDLLAAEPGPMTAKSPRSASIPPEPPQTFDQHYARGVDALLARSYSEAYASFVAAQKLGSTAGLEANLIRLRAMGYGQ